MKKLLVIRNDKLGDFMLILPALALLKKAMPALEITALVPEYTAPMAEICPYIDNILLDVPSHDKQAVKALVAKIREQRFDATINFYASLHNAKICFASCIKKRFAPATKIFQFLYNYRIKQRRSQSVKPEYEYNLDLARAFLQEEGIDALQIEVHAPYLFLDPEKIEQQRTKLIGLSQRVLKLDKKWIFVHCGSGGSATNLTLQQYADIIHGLLAKFDAQVILTAGPGELERVARLEKLIHEPQHVVIYESHDGLIDFTYSLACADLFISGSTGPLHISSALNVPTIAFYPARRSATALRWQTVNDERLSFSAPAGKHTEMDLSLISIDEIFPEIMTFVEKQFCRKNS